MSLQESERHHSDLNIFAAITAMLEGGCIYTISGMKMSHRIIRLCQQEQQKQLRAYDKATAKATAKTTTAA